MEKIEVDTKETLESIIDRVEHGEEVVIVRDGKTVAKIVQEAAPAFDRQVALAAMESIKERRKGVTLGPDLTIRDLIDEGRRDLDR